MMKRILLLQLYFIVLLFLHNSHILAQQYGTDNIMNFYTIEEPVYIPYGQKAIYQDFNTRMEIDIDSASFFSSLYAPALAFDKNGIYYEGKFIERDTTGFRLLSKEYNQKGELYIWKNQSHVYAGDSILADIDAATCVSVVNNVLRDKNGQYEKFVKITDKKRDKQLRKEYPYDSEGLSFVHLIKAKDVLSSLFERDGFREMDKESAEALGLYYIKDKNGVYFFDENSRKLKRMEGADKNSFKEASNIGGCLAYDKYHVYINDKRIDGAIGQDVRVLGVYMGYRLNSEFDRKPIYNYLLIKDPRHYWLVSEHQSYFLGTEYPEHIINRSQKGKRILIYF